MLDYVALGILVFAAVTLFYGIIVIHDIPYEISVHRNHPHQDAIHYAGWVSLFTLHALWPFLWIWATLYREDRGWGIRSDGLARDSDAAAALAPGSESEEAIGAADSMDDRIRTLEDRIGRIEQAIATAGEAQK